ncbi:MAG: hypothetical protein V2J02_17315 [Pseudomonadales bacterium]|jgi:hypothetical protein|nr:hypothetical protein [Pseudomonadales bacterium]
MVIKAWPRSPVRSAEARIDQALASGNPAKAVIGLADSLPEDELRSVAMCALLRLVVVRQRERRSR